jgi:hypothetical protein
MSRALWLDMEYWLVIGFSPFRNSEYSSLYRCRKLMHLTFHRHKLRFYVLATGCLATVRTMSSSAHRHAANSPLSIPCPQIPAHSRLKLRLPSSLLQTKLKSVLCYDWRSVGQSPLVWGTHWGPRPDHFTFIQLWGCWYKGAVSYERTGLLFTVAADPRQHVNIYCCRTR